MGIGKSGEPIEIAKAALQEITGKKPSNKFAKGIMATSFIY